MTIKKLITLLLVLLLGQFLLTAAKVESREVKKSFENITSVEITTVSGDCRVVAVPGARVNVTILYTYPEDCFAAELSPEGSVLVLREEFRGTCSGRSLWKLDVPVGTAVKYKSASGDLAVSGLKSSLEATTASGDFELKDIDGDVRLKSASGDVSLDRLTGDLSARTASGDFDLSKIKGDLEIATASGDVEAEDLEGKEISIRGASSDIEVANIRGALQVKTASGDVSVRGARITAESAFKTASGDVEIELAETSAYNLTVATASGDALLDYNGHLVNGFFEFEAKVDDGRIVSPISFDSQETFSKYGQEYMRKSFTRKSKTPKILIKTASGTAELRE